MRIYRGIIFTYPHGDYFRQGLKQMNIRAKYLPSILSKNLLVIQNKMALGIVKFTKIIAIKRSEIKKYYKYHHISPTEVNKWWRHTIKQFYAYKMKTIQIFKKPKPVEYPSGPRILIKPENIHFKKID
jgi:hypothetical protein